MKTRKLELTIPNINLQRVMVLALIVMAFVIGLLYQKLQNASGGSTATTTGTNQPAAAPPAATVSIDQIKGVWDKEVVKFGDKNRKVLFVEIGDPSCPYCHAATGENHTIYQKLGGSSFQLVADGGTYVAPVTEMRKLVDSGKASFAYIYYPGHGTGEMAMKAMYCANEKGKFWEVHDILMSDKAYDLINNTIKNDKAQAQALVDFVKGAGVDGNFLKGCLEGTKYDQRLADDRSLATSLAVQGTPGFYVNGNSFPGAYSWNDMKSIVDTALK